MKSLIVYYSRTGNTERVAKLLAEKLKCDIEKLQDLKSRKGILGWIFGGRDGMNMKMTKIGKVSTNPENYDLVILGTPIWVNATPAMRTYIHEFGNRFKKVAFFCTMGGTESAKLFEEMEKDCNKNPISILAVSSGEITANKYTDKVTLFAKGLLKK